ncbi:MAG: hypothetical protein ABI857_01500 [Acidobacteriota bacterium]
MERITSKLTVAFVVLLLFAATAATANSQEKSSSPARERRPRTSEVVTPAGKSGTGAVLDKVYADVLQPENTIKVRVRYKKEYGYRGDTSAFGYIGPTSCDAFVISPAVGSGRPKDLIRISSDSKMEDVGGYYVCSYLVSFLPLNQTITINASVSSTSEAWKGGSQAQPPPGQQRMIWKGIQNVTLTAAQPRAAMVFEMVYAPPPPPPR